MKIEREPHLMASATDRQGNDVGMRSTTEARWGNFFTAAGFDWKYEPKTFPLSNGQKYTPDFLVRNLGWVECKPTIRHLKESWPRMELFLAEHCAEKTGFESKLFAFINSRPPLTLSENVLFEGGKIWKPNAHKMGVILLEALGANQEQGWPQINNALRKSSTDRANRMMHIKEILLYTLEEMLS